MCLILEYTVYFKSISYNKESWVLEKVQATYTDVLQSSSGLYARTYISTPKQVQLFINTRSGVGSKHEVLLSSRDLRIVPKIYTHTFSLNQYFNFHVCCGYYAMKGGVFYTMNVTAYSRGSTPVTREYFTTAISYPEKPVKDRSWSATTTSIWLSVSIEGIIHGWRLSLVHTTIKLELKAMPLFEPFCFRDYICEYIVAYFHIKISLARDNC